MESLFFIPTVLLFSAVLIAVVQDLITRLPKCADCGEHTHNDWRNEFTDNKYRCEACWEVLAE